MDKGATKTSVRHRTVIIRPWVRFTLSGFKKRKWISRYL